jgi:hypothetical protein
MKKIYSLFAAALVALPCSSLAQRTGTSITIDPGSLPVSNTVPTITYGSVWQVYYASLSKLYRSNNGTCCNIARTGNTYTVKVSAFSKAFVYVQTQAGELSLTKTEYISTSKTTRQVLVWNFSTKENNATSTCTVENQTLTKNVWKTTTPASLWLQSYISVSNMNTPL